ncbi:TDP-N-acetylfucosamine:lipid II N-acetylfucosaminyltransferase [Cesiribacter sp. SM1]|uniref:TDP-N-acetylfucosamine:lipid II N-acetylfucosaminyltransferase n=1 Tax=Cesiribacter sp. SM1 TaxID=2861196 RepID=UPI001CD7CEA3|nr:TDP-N-acetylfucosamine:lipid II N-acetylfucosaminyltransferase [Cesiribacter sp. SM1]
MLLHICDDEKFIDFAISQFEEVAPGKNKFLVLIDSYRHSFTYIKQTDKVVPFVLQENTLNYSQVKAVIIHYLTEEKCKIINSIPAHIPVVWLFWGQDAQKSFTDINYKPKTNALVRRLFGWQESTLMYTNWARRLVLPYKERGKALRRINYCAPVISNELDLMNRKLGLSLKELAFTYGYLEAIIPDSLTNLRINGKNILVGNSSSAACNHIESFDLIKRSNDWQDRKVIVPLSYGNKRYRNEIVRIGKDYFGENFVPIIDFMPLEKYNAYLSSCSVSIMNHNRQQALGNIIILLWLGARVYMDTVNPLFQYLVNKGLAVESVQSVMEQGVGFSFEEALSVDDVGKNRLILQKLFKREVVLNNTKHIADKFLNSQNTFVL